MSASSKQVFVNNFRRNTLCSPGGHIVSADPVNMYHVVVRLRTLEKIIGLKLTISFDKGAGDETREKNNDLLNTTDMYTILKG